MNKEEVEFHITVGDYFGTLATTLDLLRQVLEKQGLHQEQAELLQRLSAELLYLQENHGVE